MMVDWLRRLWPYDGPVPRGIDCMDVPPPKKYLNPSGFSSATTVSLPDGSSYSYDPSETDRSGRIRPTGFRDVDRWLLSHESKVPA